MNYLTKDFSANAGDRVEVVLHGNAANVMLLDDNNFQNYKSRRQFAYYGGHYTASPVHITVPETKHWNLIIDLGGAAGRVEASVRLIPR